MFHKKTISLLVVALLGASGESVVASQRSKGSSRLTVADKLALGWVTVMTGATGWFAYQIRTMQKAQARIAVVPAQAVPVAVAAQGAAGAGSSIAAEGDAINKRVAQMLTDLKMMDEGHVTAMIEASRVEICEAVFQDQRFTNLRDLFVQKTDLAQSLADLSKNYDEMNTKLALCALQSDLAQFARTAPSAQSASDRSAEAK